jgi:hypothetical protein
MKPQEEEYFQGDDVILNVIYNRRIIRDSFSDLESRFKNPPDVLAEFTKHAEITALLEVSNLDNDNGQIIIKEEKVEQRSREKKFTLGSLPAGTYLARVNWDLASSAAVFEVNKK